MGSWSDWKKFGGAIESIAFNSILSTNPRGSMKSASMQVTPDKFVTLYISEGSSNPCTYLEVTGAEIIQAQKTSLSANESIAWLIKTTGTTLTVSANGSCNVNWFIVGLE